MSQAILGAKITIESVDGPRNIEIPMGSSFGDTLVLENLGLFQKDLKERGNHKIKIDIEIPKIITERQKELLL